MVNKPKFLKKLLTTASAMTVALGATNAYAAGAVNTVSINPAGPSAFSIPANWQQGAANLAPTANAASIIFVGRPQGINVDTPGVTYGTINLLGNGTQTITVTQNAGFEAIISDISPAAIAAATAANNGVAPPMGGQRAAATVNFNVNAAVTMNFKQIAALNNITLSNAAANATFNTDGVTVTGTIAGGGAGQGIVTVNANNVVFNGAIGAGVNTIAKFAVNDAKSATIAGGLAAANNVTIGNGSTLTVSSNITATDITANAAGQGTLTFTKNSVVNSTIGATAGLSAVNIGPALVELTGAGDALTATQIAFTDNNAILKLSVDNTKVTGNISTTINGSGVIQVNAGTGANALSIFGGNVGSADKMLGSVQFLRNLDDGIIFHNLNLQVNVNQFTTANNGMGQAFFVGDTILLNSNFGQNGKSMKAVSLIANNAATAATTATLAAGKSVYADFFLDVGANFDNILILQDGTLIQGNIYTGTLGKGTLQIAGNATINQITTTKAGTFAPAGGGAAIPAADAKINQIVFNTAGKTLTVLSGPAINTTNGINFTADATLNYTGNAGDLDLSDGPVTVLVNAKGNGTGTIMVNNLPAGGDITLGQVGDPTVANTSLKLLEATGGAGIILNKNASINQINVGSQNATLNLNNANGQFLIENFNHTNGNGILAISQNNMTLKKGSFADDNQLNNIKFNGDLTLNIEDGVNFSVADGNGTGFWNMGANQGVLNFIGSSTVNAVVGSNNTFKNITIQGNNNIVNFNKKVNLAGAITIGNTATAIFGADLIAATVDGAGLNQGTLVFNNATAITTAAAIGGTSSLAAIQIGGADINFTGARFATTNLAFTNTEVNSGSTTATFTKIGADAFIDTTITTVSADRSHNITLPAGKNQQFNLPVGTAQNAFGNFTLTGDDTITINNNFYAGVTTNTSGKGSVNFVKNNAFALNLGSATNALNQVTFTTSGAVQNGVWATNIIVNPNMTATFTGTVSATGGMTLNAGSNATFNKAYLSSAITGSAAATGNVIFNDDVRISNNLSSLANVNFVGNNKRAIMLSGGAIAAGNISFGPTFRAEARSNSKFVGATQLSQISLGGNTVTFTGGASQFNGNSAVGVAALGGNSVGQIVVDGAGSSLNMDNATALTIYVYDKSGLPASPVQYTLFTATNGGTLTTINDNKVTIIQPKNNRFAKWSYSNNVLTQVNNASQALADVVASQNDGALSANVATLGNPQNQGDSTATLSDFSKITDDATLVDALRRLSSPVATNNQIMGYVADASKQVIVNRLGALSPLPGQQLADSGMGGVAAGDDAAVRDYGVWLSPFYMNDTQKARKGGAGFKSNTAGATIGFDTMANLDMSVGLAFTYAKSDVKHKNFKSGDKTRADSFMFSVYGIQQLTDNWFLQAVASYSSSKVKNKERRITSSGSETATGKFDSSTLGGEMMVGYSYYASEVMLTPLAGVSFTRVNDGGYKETGTTSQNLNIVKKAVNKVEAVAGFRAQMNPLDMGGMGLTPELHGFVRHDFRSKNPTLTAKLGGMVGEFVAESPKPAKTTYNLGIGVLAKSGMYEYGAGYDLTLANKYMGQQGTLKVRVNF